MCKDGHIGVAWFLVLLPFILMFVILGSVMIYQRDTKKNNKRRMHKEGMHKEGMLY
jgi:preprotein translocase subunit YajC